MTPTNPYYYQTNNDGCDVPLPRPWDTFRYFFFFSISHQSLLCSPPYTHRSPPLEIIIVFTQVYINDDVDIDDDDVHKKKGLFALNVFFIYFIFLYIHSYTLWIICIYIFLSDPISRIIYIGCQYIRIQGRWRRDKTNLPGKFWNDALLLIPHRKHLDISINHARAHAHTRTRSALSFPDIPRLWLCGSKWGVHNW